MSARQVEAGKKRTQELLAQLYAELMSIKNAAQEAARKEFLKNKPKAEQGDTEAQFHLGTSYTNGGGVQKDYAEAYAWLNLAAKASGQAARARDELEKKMSPQQLAAGQKRTGELRAQIYLKLKSGGK